MTNLRKIHIALSIVITAIFLTVGIVWCKSSYQRLWETVCELFSSIQYYFCEIFAIEHNTVAEIVTPSEILKGESSILPTSSGAFGLKCRVYFSLLVNGSHLGSYFRVVGAKIGNFSRLCVLLLPIIIAVIIVIKKIYGRENVKHNRDTVPLWIFKKISGVTYQPIKRFVVDYVGYLERYSAWKTAWLWIWIINVNFLSIGLAFLSYYFYFAVSFDLSSLYPQIVNLCKDLFLVVQYFPWFLTGTLAWGIFTRQRIKIAQRKLRHFEARNCGFINELPIVSMTCGSMGKRKTTLITDMALSQEVMFRQKALEILQRADMKLPYFPWICFEKELRVCMEHHTVYNLASTKTWVALKRSRFEKHGNVKLQLYGYNIAQYGSSFNDALRINGLWDILETYAQAYFIYVIESSLILSNYSIRTDNEMLDNGNFPMWVTDFFPEGITEGRHAHILDFDVLRLGRKLIADNPNIGSFEFGVVAITEIGKERGNNLELKEVKKGADEANQKNDLFNAWLKMCRHSATVDNFPFIKVFTDEQRPESWGSDCRDLCDIIHIISSGEQRLALPFYIIEDMIAEWVFDKFIWFYTDMRYKRGDNTLLVHLLKSITAWVWRRNIRIYNRYGYSIAKLEKERGTMDRKGEHKKYYLMNRKIYASRFTTDCFSDYFNDLAGKSGVGLNDYREYLMEKASVDELKAQNSYFINGLY